VQKQHSRASKGKAKAKAKASHDRGARGYPVTVTHALSDGKKLLSGADWEKEFPASRSIDDLTPEFKSKVNSFISALKSAGVQVIISATYQSKERAYLMHYCCMVAAGSIKVDKVPAMAGVNIEWAHRGSNGNVDVNASRALAAVTK
jgi:hypothetical protein